MITAVQNRFLFMPMRPWLLRLWAIAAATALLLCGYYLVAQVDGDDRGIAPVNSSSDFEVTNVSVDVTGDTAEEARINGWQEAQRKAWVALYKQLNKTNSAPGLSDGQLDGIVSAIVVEQEQIGPKRYIATLGVLFDRARGRYWELAAGFCGHLPCS
jgi:hypothetical protein